MKTVIADCETDGFLDQMTKLWTIQLGDPDTDEVTVYADQPGFPPLADAVARLKDADRQVFHFGVGFDMDAINRFYPGTVTMDKLYDTLVASRLADPDDRGHSLDAIGIRMGILKGKYEGDFRSFTPDLVEYAAQDIVVTRARYREVIAALAKQDDVLRTEHLFARIIVLQERNGFLLDLKECEKLVAEFRGEMTSLEIKLQQTFPPIEVLTPFTPKVNSKKYGYEKGVPTVKRSMDVFSPGSRPQIASRLKALGWRPRHFTADGRAKVDDAILQTLPYPEAKLLAEYFVIQKKVGQIADGDNAWLKLVSTDNRVRGRVNPIGCAPGRCSHWAPNMAQVNKKDKRMRAVWLARPGWKLVGIDGEGLQARICAHYLAKHDDGEFAKRVSEGRKSDRSDIHSANLIGLSKHKIIPVPLDADDDLWGRGRDEAKRCLYCVWFGGGDPKLGATAIDGCKTLGIVPDSLNKKGLGGRARTALFSAMRGFKELSEGIVRAAERGYLVGIDGRKVPIRSPHSALVFLMQAGEAAVMKLAKVIFHYETCPANGWEHGVDYGYCANVHDEVQIECRPEIADQIGQAFANCITEAGVRLKLRCPLAGDYHVGDTWADTH